MSPGYREKRDPGAGHRPVRAPTARRPALVAVWLLAALLACRSAGAQTALEVEQVGLTVSDMERSIDFFSRVLSFEKVSDMELAGESFERLSGVFGSRARVVRMRLGAEEIELTEYLAPRGRPIPIDSRSNDRWFQHIAIIVSDMDRAYERLRRHDVQHASTGPQRLPAWNPNAGGIEAFYFKDPDGHVLEILEFPPGKGDRRWQQGERLFLGIDHTAIVSSDTEASLAFYRDRLGMKIVGESVNYGTEQEHLNNVFGARLRITTLRAPAGPAVELLEYLAPRDGRPFPLDTRSNDLWHWQTRVRVRGLDDLMAELSAADFTWISPGVVSFAEADLGVGAGALVRDRDGHALMLVEN